MRLPESLPSLTAGAHDADSGEACVMEYVSVLAGEPWSDRPECTHPVLAHEARTANDLLDDAGRSALVPLVGRLFGTSEDSPVLRTRLRLAQVAHVVQALEPGSGVVADAWTRRAEALLAEDRDQWVGDDPEVDLAWTAARELAARTGELDPSHEEHHLGASRLMAFAAGPDVGAAEAWALAALVAAHRAAAGDCRADCGDPASRGRRTVRGLRDLLDVYDAVTDRVQDPVSPARARALAAHL